MQEGRRDIDMPAQ